jgi:hypothetical protein
MTGRPSKLTPEHVEAICSRARTGVDMRTAALSSGIAPSTLFSWLKRARDERARRDALEREGLPWRPRDQAFVDLLERFEQARAEGEAALAAMILRAGQEDWRAASWLLARGYGWTETQTVKVGGLDGGPVAHDHVVHVDRDTELAALALTLVEAGVVDDPGILEVEVVAGELEPGAEGDDPPPA